MNIKFLPLLPLLLLPTTTLANSDTPTSSNGSWFYYTMGTTGGGLTIQTDDAWTEITYDPTDANTTRTFLQSNTISVTYNTPTSTVPDNAHRNFSKLQYITLPSSPSSIGAHAFQNCPALSSITIPSTVTSIGEYAFSGCANLQSLTIPSGVTSIGDYTFSGCSKLQSITIPSTVTSIGKNAFANCSSLQSIVIPSTVTSIGNDAFANCSSLSSITILANPSLLTTNTLSNLPDNATLYYDPQYDNLDESLDETFTCYSLPDCGNGYYVDTERQLILTSNILSSSGWSFNTNTSTLTISTADALSEISNNKFIYSYLYENTTTVILMSECGITELDHTYFARYSNLTSITLPNTLSTVKSGTFFENQKLTEVFYPGNLSNLSFEDNTPFASQPTIYGKEGDLSSSVSSSSYTLNNTLDFYDGYYIHPTSNTLIPTSSQFSNTGWAFNTNNNTLTINYTGSDNSEVWNIIGGDTNNATSQYLKANTTTVTFTANCSISQILAFHQYSKLSSVTQFPTTANLSIGTYAFTGTALTSISLPSNVTSIGNGAFSYCKQLTSANLSQCPISAIPPVAFSSCPKLTTLNLPTTLTSINESAFQYCPALKNVYVNTDATTYSANNLHSFTLSNNAFPTTTATLHYNPLNTNIENFKPYFSNLSPEFTGTGYTFVKDSLTILSDEAWKPIFNNDNNVRTILQSFTKTLAFDKNFKLYKIPTCQFLSFTNLTTVSFLRQCEFMIYENAFANCSNLANISLSNAIEINDEAFSGCTSLTTISISPHLHTIGAEAFSGCTNLTTLTIPTTNPKLTTINANAFYGCSSLTNITLPSSLTSIGDKAFAGCSSSSITELTLPATLTHIGNEAFAHCAYLTNVYLADDATTYSASNPHIIYLGNTPSGADNGNALNTDNDQTLTGTNIFPTTIKNNGATLHYNSQTTYIGNLDTQNLRSYFAIAQPTSLQSPTNTTPTTTPLYYDLQGRPLSHPLPNTPTIRILNNRSTLILTK